MLFNDQVDQALEQLFDRVLRRGLLLVGLLLAKGLLPGHAPAGARLSKGGTGEQGLSLPEKGVKVRGARAFGTGRARGSRKRGSMGAAGPLEATHLCPTRSSVSLYPFTPLVSAEGLEFGGPTFHN